MVGYASHTFSDLYSVKLPPADRPGGAHTIDARLALTRVIGAAGTHWKMQLFPSDHDRHLAAGALRDAGIEPGTAVALNVGGSLPSKRWPPEHWAHLAHALSEDGMPIVVVGGPLDTIAGEFVRERLGKGVKAAFLLGRLPLMASAALLTLCRAHVTPDSGLMQAGLALDVPTVALFGPDDPSWTGPHPKQERAVVVQADQSLKPPGYDRKTDREGVLMRSIPPEQVLSALASLIG